MFKTVGIGQTPTSLER